MRKQSIAVAAIFALAIAYRFVLARRPELLLRIVALGFCMGALPPPHCLAQERWQGVDETVVGKVAREAGRPPRAPLLPTDQGDLQLFAFLLAGALGGFVAGYTFRGLFPPSQRRSKDHAPTE